MNGKLRLSSLAFLLILCFHAVSAQTVLFAEDFNNIKGKGGNDNQWNNVSGKAVTITTEGFGDWTLSNVYKASQCVKVGKKNGKGSATTPSFSAKGSATLTFRAGAWKDHKTEMSVTVTSQDETVYNETVTLKNSEFTDYQIDLKGLKGATTITFSAIQDKENVFFLDEVKVMGSTVDPNAEPIAPVLTDAFTFWPEAHYAPSATIYITPTEGMETFYTTDGTDPSRTNGTLLDEESDVKIDKTTTVKAITYNGEKQSNIVAQTYTLGQTLTDIRSFNDLTVGDSARLYFSDEADARVVFVNGKDVHLRDHTGAVCLSGVKASRTMRHNQHIAGWIIGKKGERNGMPLFEPTSKTNTNWLIIADPVTEQPTYPTEVTPATYNDHQADWIVMKDLRIQRDAEGQTITGSNGTDRFAIDNSLLTPTPTDITTLYDGALTDLCGIAISHADGKGISPVAQGGYAPWIYVLNQNEEHRMAADEISNATVRLTHPLSSSYWNTLCLPFDAKIEGAQIREYKSVEGSTMKFEAVESIKAGVPYLIKPTEDIAEPVFHNIVLTTKQPQTVMNNGYGFVGIYSPTRLKTDKTHRFLGNDDQLLYPSSESENLMPGTRAYFVVPAQDTHAKVMIDGAEITGIEMIGAETTRKARQTYNLNGQRMGEDLQKLPKGLYIIDGRKVIVK